MANSNIIDQTCIEMPVDVFAEAVRLAQANDFGKDSRYWHSVMGACEEHPALKTLTEWWNANAPNHASRCAGFAMPWVMSNEFAGIYLCGYYETPATEFPKGYNASVSARVGDEVLVEFVKSHRDLDLTKDNESPKFQDVIGRVWMEVGVSNKDVYSGEHDESWYSLEALRCFPNRFPKVWKRITQQIAKMK